MLLHLHFKMGLHAVKVNLKIMLIISKERRAGGRDRGRKEGGRRIHPIHYTNNARC